LFLLLYKIYYFPVINIVITKSIFIIFTITKTLNNISIHSQREDTGEFAQIILVGTRKDSVSNPEDHQKISNELMRRLKKFPAFASVNKYDNANMGSKGRTTLCFFPVDNTLSSNDPVVQDIKKVNTSMNNYCNYNVDCGDMCIGVWES